VCLIGINSVAEHSFLQNPVGSNGRISTEEEERLRALLGLPAVHRASHRVVILHHHLFPTRDAQRLQDVSRSLGLMEKLEHGTLKLRGKRRVMSLLASGGTDLILHGHVHFSARYERDGIPCINSAGAVMPLNPEVMEYHIVVLDEDIRATKHAVPAPKRTSRSRNTPATTAKC
jgi:hypothetical protein